MNNKGIKSLLFVVGFWFFQSKMLHGCDALRKTKQATCENAGVGVKELRLIFTAHVATVYQGFDDALKGNLSLQSNQNSYAIRLINYLKTNYSFAELLKFYNIRDALIKFFMALCDTTHIIVHGKRLVPAAVICNQTDIDSVLRLCPFDEGMELGVAFDAATFDNQEILEKDSLDALFGKYHATFKESLSHLWTAADMAKLKDFFKSPLYNKVQSKGGFIVLFLRMIQPVNVASTDIFINDVMSGLKTKFDRFKSFLLDMNR